MTFESILHALVSGFADPLSYAVRPDKRIYWPFLLSSALLAAGVWFVRLRKRCSPIEFLLPKRIWLHRSTWLDLRLVFVRSAIDLVLFAGLTVSVQGVAFDLAKALWEHVAIFPRFDVDAQTLLVPFSVASFMAEDFARYVLHRLAHRVPFLWELHKVHHSAEVLTPLTVYRTHPLESLMVRGGAHLALGLVTGIFVWIFPGKVKAFEILGVYGLGFVWSALGANLRHSHVWLSYGPWLERMFISPAQHQIHHSAEPHHHHSNFGSALAIWDALFGTLYVTRGRERVRFGLPIEMRNHDDSVASALFAPLVAIARGLRRGRTMASYPVAVRSGVRESKRRAHASTDTHRPST